jgi:hypothetical protein
MRKTAAISDARDSTKKKAPVESTGARLTRHRSREPGYTLREGSVERFYALRKSDTQAFGKVPKFRKNFRENFDRKSCGYDATCGANATETCT